MRRYASFWEGAPLGPIERASANSFRALGLDLTVYSYSGVAGLPEGVAQADAREVFDPGALVRHARTGSPAIHADLFRYALMAETDRVWVDLDFVILRPMDGLGAAIFGFETADTVNNAVLRLPASSPALQRMRALQPGHKGVPPHLTGLRRAEYWLKHHLTGGLPIERWPWGATGPLGLTHALRATGEIAQALPVEAFYAVPFEDTARFLAPGGLTPADLPPTACICGTTG